MSLPTSSHTPPWPLVTLPVLDIRCDILPDGLSPGVEGEGSCLASSLTSFSLGAAGLSSPWSLGIWGCEAGLGSIPYSWLHQTYSLMSLHPISAVLTTKPTPGVTWPRLSSNPDVPETPAVGTVILVG